MDKTTKVITMLMLLALPILAQAKNHSNLPYYFQNKKAVHQNTAGNKINSIPLAKTETLVSYHGKVQTYFWDSVSAKNSWHWQFGSVSIYKYDNIGRTVGSWDMDTLEKDTSNRYLTTYGPDNRRFYVEDYYSNNSWKHSNSDTTIYDSKGVENLYVYYRWLSNKWKINDGQIYYNTYDANQYMTMRQELDYDTVKGWVYNNELDMSLNSDGSWKSVITKNWNGTSWVNADMTDSIQWHNWTGNPFKNLIFNFDKYIERTWNGTNWINSKRHILTYDANGGSVEIVQSWSGAAWKDSARNTISLDSKGNITHEKYEYWGGAAGWQTSDENNYILSYSNIDITQEIVQNLSQSSNKLVNSDRYIYSNFKDIDNGINEGVNTPDNFILFPNPASAIIHLQAVIPNQELVTISIFNIQGKEVLKSTHNSNELSPGMNISIQNLPRGMYLLRAVSGNLDINQKFIKE